MKKIVYWYSKMTSTIGHGKPLEAYLADDWVQYGNEAYPDIIHIAIAVDLTKMQGCSVEVRE